MRIFPALLFLSASLFAPVSGAQAQSGALPNTLSLTCKEAEALVKSRGTVTLRSGDMLMNRYTSTGTLCYRERMIAEPASVRTRDRSDCQIGYICIPPEPKEFD